MAYDTSAASVLPLIFLLFLPLFFFFFSRFRTSGSWPPGPPPLPIIGNLHLLGDMPHRSLRDLALKYGDLMYLQLGQVPTIVVSSARLAREVLKTHDRVFASRPALIAPQWLSFGCSDVSSSPYGAYWRQVRKICVTELLGSKRIQSFQDIRSEEIGRLMASIANAAGQGGSRVNLSEAFFDLANDILCRVAFGRRFYKSGLNEIVAETIVLLGAFNVGDFFPFTGWLNAVTGMTRRLKRNLRDLDSMSNEIIAEHMDPARPVPSHGDFVDVLLRVQREGNLELPITEDNIKALVLDMFMAGTDPISKMLEWIMLELVRHPQVMKKTQEEIRNVAKKEGTITESDLAELKYMTAVINETLRLHLTTPLLMPRESIEPCELDGYTIPPKTRVFVNAYAIALDPHSWDNPEAYRPERFIEKTLDITGREDFELLPFGGGRRGCPGYSFGLASINLTLALLLCHFDWSLPEDVMLEGINLDENFGLTMKKKEPVVLIPSHPKDSAFKMK